MRLASLLIWMFASSAFAEEEAPKAAIFGIGAGWTFPNANPTHLFSPSAVSARVKVGPIELEPAVDVGGGSGQTQNNSTVTPPGQPVVETRDTDRDSSFRIEMSADARYAIFERGAASLIGIGGIGFASRSSDRNRNVDNVPAPAAGDVDRLRTNTTAFDVHWGFGVAWFALKNVGISADIRNPLFTTSRTTTTRDLVQTQNNNQTTSSIVDTTGASDYGLIFRPVVRAMVHIWF